MQSKNASKNMKHPPTPPYVHRVILVVDDDEEINRLARKVLTRAGFNCRGFLNGTEALEAVKKEQCPVLMLDQKLPDMTGTELVRKLINLGYDIPFIAMTGHGDEKVAVDMMKLGARDYLVKGFDLKSILPMVFDRLFTELDTEHQLEETEKRLRKNEALYKSLLESTKAVAYEVDFITGSFTYISPQVVDLTGYAPEKWTDINFRTSIIHSDDKDETIRICKEAVQKGRDFECEYRISTAGNKILWVKDLISFIKKEDTPVAMRGLLIDITRQKVMEKELRQKQKMESVGRLAGGVAHDFNNMLGVILGHTELALLQADETHDLHADLKEIQNAATRSANITKQLLAFARKQTISPRQLDLNHTLEDMLNMLRRLIGEDIDLVWQPGGHLWPVKMDPSQIDQILANLCVNARDAIDGVGRLTIETGIKSFDEQYCKEHSGFVPGDFVLLAVSDTGCGMDKEILKNLFDPFFTTKKVGKGTGLGLATIYGIVKQNNGFITVVSEPGQGSTFRIYLPRLVTDDCCDTAAAVKKEAACGTETILLVEDEISILEMVRMMMEKKGYTVLTASTPKEALEKAKQHSGNIDLLMTDVVMPEMNGRELAGKVAALYQDIRLLFMSGYTADVIAQHGVLDDGVAFIQKPFSMADLMVKVQDELNK